MEKKYILALDIGTSSLKAAIVDKNLNIIRSVQSGYTYHVVENMGVEINPEKIWKAVVKATKIFSPYSNNIGVIALCTFCPTLTLMNTKGEALRNTIIHLDRRSYPQARSALKIIGAERFLRITGNLPFPGAVSLTSLLWIKKHEPEIFKSTAVFGHLNTFVHKRFVGKWVIDPTNASMTGLYETVKYGNWSMELAEEFAIDTMRLPEVIQCDEIIGGLSRAASKELQIKSGIPVIMGGGDTACAAYGAGGKGSGEILNISGSNELLTITTDRPLPSKKYNLRTHVLKNKWLIFVITVSGIALEWYRSQFCRDLEKNQFYNDYLPKVLHGIDSTERFYPHVSGDRYSMVQKRGSFTGLTLSTTREDLLRAIVHGTMKYISGTLEDCRRKIGLSGSIFVTGGGANETIQKYKEERIFSGYKLTLKKECSLIGVAKLATAYVDKIPED